MLIFHRASILAQAEGICLRGSSVWDPDTPNLHLFLCCWGACVLSPSTTQFPLSEMGFKKRISLWPQIIDWQMPLLSGTDIRFVLYQPNCQTATVSQICASPRNLAAFEIGQHWIEPDSSSQVTKRSNSKSPCLPKIRLVGTSVAQMIYPDLFFWHCRWPLNQMFFRWDRFDGMCVFMKI